MIRSLSSRLAGSFRRRGRSIQCAVKGYVKLKKFEDRLGRAVVNDIKDGFRRMGSGVKKWARGVGQTYKAVRHWARGEKGRAILMGATGFRNMRDGTRQANSGFARVGSVAPTAATGAPPTANSYVKSRRRYRGGSNRR